MVSISRSIPFTASQVRVALVQLRSPFGAPNAELSVLDNETIGPVYVWRNKNVIQQRIEKVKTILAFLKKTFKPNLVAFPEYSVPAADHDLFQEFANSNSCIVVPGTYCESNQKHRLYRNNVLRVYLPGEDPIEIVKHDRFEPEKDVLITPPGSPNIVHLGWQVGFGT